MKKEYILLGLALLAAWYFLYYKKAESATAAQEQAAADDAAANTDVTNLRQYRSVVPYQMMG